MKRLTLFILLFVFTFTARIEAQSKQQFGDLGNFKLENGQVIKNCRVGYRTYGQIDQSHSNIIIFPTWFGGISKELAGLIGPGNMADSTKYYVITFDALGDGVSSSPSNSRLQPNSEFPKFTIMDMVHSQHELLTRILHIHHIYAVMGISMGGMQTFQWMTAFPNFMDKAIPVVGSPRLTSYDLLLWTAELNAIKEGLQSHASEKSIAKTVNDIQTMNLYTPTYRRDKTPPSDFKKFIKKADMNFEKSFNPYDWASQLRAMMAQNVARPFGGSMEKAAKAVNAQVLIIPSLQDHMVNPGPALHFAKLINAKVYKINNDCGHLGVGCDQQNVNMTINRFLDK